MKKLVDKNGAADLLNKLSNEFAVVKNPEYIYPEYELYPIAPALTSPLEFLSAAVMDMDGTTTTTEELCIHSLESMIRTMSGKLTVDSWVGLDHTVDYPNIIGNSTTKHVEYLITKYQHLFLEENIKRAFLYAAVWTLLNGLDEKRKEEVTTNLVNLNLLGISEDSYYKELLANGSPLSKLEETISAHFFQQFKSKFHTLSKIDLVKMGIDIYYQRYHEVLQRIKRGESKDISTELFNDPDKHLIQPMPGVLFFLSLIKGWLGPEADTLVERLIEEYRIKSGKKMEIQNLEVLKKKILSMSLQFEKNPAKVAIVTSSIFYEADIVMGEVFNVLSSQLPSLPLSNDRKEIIGKKLQHYRNVYDAFVTASDSTEIRLKPHRDLYSIALHRLNIPTKDFKNVIGFEDSESGTIAIRAAGIGRCVAVPFAQTKGHNFEAATIICSGGIPEVVLAHNIFFKH